MLNKEKISIFFSKNTPREVKDNIIDIAGVIVSECFEKYLSLPVLIGKSKSKAFEFLLVKTWSRISNWKSKFLFVVEKEILLKVVLQAIPSHIMEIFLILKTIIDKLNSLFKNFWWDFNDDSSKI